MSIYVFRDWTYDLNFTRPSRMLDQSFGARLAPTLRRPYHSRPWRLNSADAGSAVRYDGNGFHVTLDVKLFSPDELQVKVVDNSVLVEGKHEEKPDEHGLISRQFVRRYFIPEGYAVQHILSTLSSDGMLSITIPKRGATKEKERIIPITQTGPHNADAKQKTDMQAEEQTDKN